MKEKILALLTAKFAGVRKDGLARLAQALSLQVADENEAGALVDKLTPERVNEFVTDYRKDVDKEVSDSNKTFEKTLKGKYDFIEKKGEPDPGKDPDPSKQQNPNDIAAIVAQAVKAAVEPLQQKLSSFEGQKVTETRLQQIEAKFKDVPESYKAQRLADAKLIVTTMDDAAFAEYSTRLDSDITAFNQELANKSLSGQSKPNFGARDTNGVSAATQAFISDKAEGSKTALSGKEL